MSKPLAQKKTTYTWFYLVSHIVVYIYTISQENETNWVSQLTYSQVISKSFSQQVMEEIRDKTLTLERLFKIFAKIFNFDCDVKFDDAKKKKIFATILNEFRKYVEKTGQNPKRLRLILLSAIERMENIDGVTTSTREHIEHMRSKIPKDGEMNNFAWGLLVREILDFLSLTNPLMIVCEEEKRETPVNKVNKVEPVRKRSLKKRRSELEFDAIPDSPRE